VESQQRNNAAPRVLFALLFETTFFSGFRASCPGSLCRQDKRTLSKPSPRRQRITGETSAPDGFGNRMLSLEATAHSNAGVSPMRRKLPLSKHQHWVVVKGVQGAV